MKPAQYMAVALGLLVMAAPVHSATYSNLAGSATGFQYQSQPRSYVIEQTHNFAKQAVTTGDVVKLIHVPAGARALFVQAEILTAATAIDSYQQTISVGDSADPDGWLTTFSATNEAQFISDAAIAYTFTPAMASVTNQVVTNVALETFYYTLEPISPITNLLLESVAVMETNVLTNVVLEAGAIELPGLVTNATASVQYGDLVTTAPTGGAVTVTITPAYGLGRYYLTNDTINITAAGRITNGSVRVRLAAIDLSQ